MIIIILSVSIILSLSLSISICIMSITIMSISIMSKTRILTPPWFLGSLVKFSGTSAQHTNLHLYPRPHFGFSNTRKQQQDKIGLNV